MFHEYDRQLDKDGKPGPIKDICVVYAQRIYLERKDRDTNPQLVQMILHGEIVPHWYYRSDQWVDQPYSLPRLLLQPYRGPSELAYPWLYGNDKFIPDEELRQITEKGYFIDEEK